MPIKDKSRYPKDWKAISKRIRFERAGDKCERCGAPHGQIIYRNPEKLEDYVLIVDGDYVKPDGTPLNDYGFEYEKAVTVILTTAHLDHNPQNNDDSNLEALCQLCHLRHDAKHHAQNARRTKLDKKYENQLDLFD